MRLALRLLASAPWHWKQFSERIGRTSRLKSTFLAEPSTAGAKSGGMAANSQKHKNRKLDRIDMFVHDSLHTQKHMTFEFLTIWPLMPPRSVLVADDIECNCAFL